MIFADHFNIDVGSSVWFVGRDGMVYSNRVEKVVSITNRDIQIALLQEEVVAAISPAKLLPKDYREYIDSGKGLVALVFDYEEKGNIFEVTHIGTNIGIEEPQNSRLYEYYEYIYAGDSGNPIFLLVGNSPILLGCLWHGLSKVSNGIFRGGDAANIAELSAEIQQVMDDLCYGYNLEFMDLSNYDKIGK
jgi:hypothetical protein